MITLLFINANILTTVGLSFQYDTNPMGTTGEIGC